MLKDFIDKKKEKSTDCVRVSDFNFFEEDYVLAFDFERDTPEILKNTIKSKFGKNFGIKPYRKFFVVRDVYKYLSREKVSYTVRPDNLWWFSLLMNPDLALLKNITLHRPHLAKILANILGLLIHREITNIMKILGNEAGNQNNQVDTQSSAQEQNQEQADDFGDPNFGLPQSPNLTKMQKEELQFLLENITEKISNFTDLVKEVAMSVGKESTILQFSDNSIKDIDVPRSVLLKLKNIGSGISSFFESTERVQHLRDIPRGFDISFVDDTLFFERVLVRSFVDTDFRTKISLDLYLDCSGSMDDCIHFSDGYARKTEIAKGVIKSLVKLGVKFRRFYTFNNELTRVDSIKELLSISPGGGTKIMNVLNEISKTGKESLIITDLEDDFTEDMKKRLIGLKNKLSVVFVGYEEQHEKWKDYVGIAYAIF